MRCCVEFGSDAQRGPPDAVDVFVGQAKRIWRNAKV